MRRSIAFLLALLLFTVPALAYENVPTWAAQGTEFSSAAELGLIPDQLADADMSGSITRLEFCRIALELYYSLSGAEPATGLPSPYTDLDSEEAARAAWLGITSGYPDGTFRPDNTITRQELFKMLDNLLAALGRQPGLSQAEVESLVNAYGDRALLQSWAAEAAANLLYFGVTNGNLIDGETRLDPEGSTTRAQAIVMAYRLYIRFRPEDKPAETPDTTPDEAPGTTPDETPDATPEPEAPTLPEGVLTPGTALTTTGEYADRAAKREFLFGDSSISSYATEAEALANQTTITIPVWRLNSDGTKTASHMDLTVHKKLAPTILQIFTEIFHSPEQFPIKNVGGYAWRGNGTSEHNWGVAIDINWEENYYYRIDKTTGQIIPGSEVGDYWLPGEDPYSIPADSDVVSIFAKYGFGWGGDDWWTSVRDYMHFSFFSK